MQCQEVFSSCNKVWLHVQNAERWLHSASGIKKCEDNFYFSHRYKSYHFLIFISKNDHPKKVLKYDYLRKFCSCPRVCVLFLQLLRADPGIFYWAVCVCVCVCVGGGANFVQKTMLKRTFLGGKVLPPNTLTPYRTSPPPPLPYQSRLHVYLMGANGPMKTLDKKSWDNCNTPLLMQCLYQFLIVLSFFSGCFNFTILNEFDRAKGYKGVINKCDRSLLKGWYRFLGLAGKQMPDACVAIERCGTRAPGWLSGGHPTVAQGVVQRRVCFHGSYSCCRLSTSIRVRNCGAFYVYELTPTPGCYMRYCGDREQGNIIQFT